VHEIRMNNIYIVVTDLFNECHSVFILVFIAIKGSVIVMV
jgi:hypothetical protein